MDKIFKIVSEYRSKKNLLVLVISFILIEFLFAALIIPAIKESSSGYGILDSMVFVSASEYYDLFAAYTSETRLLHYFSTALDMILPLVYGSILLFTLSYLLNDFKKLRGLVFLPIITVAFDFLENAGIIISISHHMHIGDGLIYYMMTITNLKFVFLSLSFIAILIAVVYKLIKNHKGKQIISPSAKS